MTIQVVLYSRQNCHLCDEAKADLESLQANMPHQLAVIDVDSNPDLQRNYGLQVPVVEIGPYRLKAPFSRQELAMTLSAAQDRQRHITSIDEAAMSGGPQARRWTKADAFSYWFSRHYLAVFNLFVLLYLGLPILAPILMNSGIEGPARLIYRGYGFVCHQLAYRSFFLFGEQSAYPRTAAGVEGMLSYSQATGLSEENTASALYTARDYIGDEQIGYKVALCERDMLIYGGIFLFGIVYSLSGRRLPALPWYLWVLVGLVPIGIDGVSQLLSQPPFNFWEYRESTPLLRSLTGFLFGWTTAWFGYPMVEESMRDAREIMSSKLRRIQKFGQA